MMPRQMGTVVQTRLTKVGMSDVKGHKVAWVLGYTYVGNGTNGTNNTVYFLDPLSTNLLVGHSAALSGYYSSGVAPVSFRDKVLGYGPLVDIAKHYSRYVIKRAQISVESLQPATSNNMMCIVAPTRGSGLASQNIFVALATATVPGNTVADLTSMNGAVTVDSWETKTFDVTHYVAGGSGAKQNEFEIQQEVIAEEVLNGPNVEGNHEGDIPFGIAVAGNSTTAGLEGTIVHQIVAILDLEFLDYVGGMSQILSGAGIALDQRQCVTRHVNKSHDEKDEKTDVSKCGVNECKFKCPPNTPLKVIVDDDFGEVSPLYQDVKRPRYEEMVDPRVRAPSIVQKLVGK